MRNPTFLIDSHTLPSHPLYMNPRVFKMSTFNNQAGKDLLR